MSQSPSSAAHGAAHAGAGHGHSPEEVRQHVKRYLLVFYALLFGTVITVLASYVPFGNHAVNVGVALLIASAKAFLVAGYFMHLVSEKRLIYGILAFTAFFFVGLMFLILFAYKDFPPFAVTH
mgnify:CR=1 FL=1